MPGLEPIPERRVRAAACREDQVVSIAANEEHQAQCEEHERGRRNYGREDRQHDRCV